MDTAALKSLIQAAWRENAPKPFDPAKPVVKLHEATYEAEEIFEFVQCLLGIEVTMGPKVKRFEQEFAKRFGHGHAVLVNSGSSANLLAIAGVANQAVANHLKPGDEVIVPALCWSTTVWPLIQHQLVPVIVDADPKTLNIDPAEVLKAIGPKTRAIMPVPIYGNPCDMDALAAIAKKHDLLMIEDSCESLGATYKGRHVGSFGRVGTFSFYYSHHITTLEGGMVVTDDFELAETLRALRAHGWVREMDQPRKYLDAYPEIDPKFLFVNIGYNLRATEPQGAMGSIQLKKLDRFIKVRADNAEHWLDVLAPMKDLFEFVTVTPGAKSSWFGFPMVVKPGAPFTVRELMAHMRSRGIEMRPLNAGNIAGQPAIKPYPHRVVGDLPRVNYIWKNGFTFGNHQHVDPKARDYITETLNAFVREKGGEEVVSQKILVTGGAGYIGSILVPALLAEGHQVTVLDCFRYNQASLLEVCADDRLRIVRGDAREESTLAPLVKEADVLIPLAALVGVPVSEADPVGARTINFDAIKLLLSLRSPKQRVIYPCTNSGYGIGQKDKFCTEETPLKPISLYGRTKVDAEKAVLDAGNTMSFRFATVFGASPRMRTDLLVNDFVQRALRDGAVVLYEAHAKRNYLHVRDAARAFLHGLKNYETMAGGPYNVGLSDANLSKKELCERIKVHVPRFTFLEAAVGKDPDQRDYIISNEKIEKTGFRTRHSLDDGIRELIRVYQILRSSPYGNA